MVKAKTKIVKAEEVPKSKKVKKTEESEDSSSEEEVEVAKKVNGKKANGKTNGMYFLAIDQI